jgi:hypothetical protein
MIPFDPRPFFRDHKANVVRFSHTRTRVTYRLIRVYLYNSPLGHVCYTLSRDGLTPSLVAIYLANGTRSPYGSMV